MITYLENKSMDSATTITKEEARDMVKNYKGSQFFTVTFTKRSDGSTRIMNCRKGVHKDVKGEGHRYNTEDKDLVCVRDVQKRAHRMIPVDGIQAISMKGKKYVVRTAP
jgi:hypothetical protein